MRVGLLGLGAIGQSLAALLAREPPDQVQLVGALVRDLGRARPPGSPRALPDVEALLHRRPEVVVEAAGHQALRTHGPAILRAGVDLLMVSVGALADEPTERAIRLAATEGGSRAIVASGAIGGLDALAAARVGGLERVVHTTRKPAHTLVDAATARGLSGPLEVFRGSARAGSLRFPESINVAAAVSLAGLGLDRTEVVVVADPSLDRNQHVVEAEGAFGHLTFAIQNVPTPENPRTGRLVAMSLLHALRNRRASFVVG